MKQKIHGPEAAGSNSKTGKFYYGIFWDHNSTSTMDIYVHLFMDPRAVSKKVNKSMIYFRAYLPVLLVQCFRCLLGSVVDAPGVHPLNNLKILSSVQEHKIVHMNSMKFHVNELQKMALLK